MGACSSQTKKPNDPQKKADTSSGKEAQKPEEKNPEAGPIQSFSDPMSLGRPPIDMQDLPQIQEVAEEYKFNEWKPSFNIAIELGKVKLKTDIYEKSSILQYEI